MCPNLYNQKYFTYQDYVQAFLGTNEKAIRNYYKEKAKQFKGEFDKRDFPRKIRERIPYERYVYKYNNTKRKRSKYKFRALRAWPKLFKEEDFPI